MSKQTKKNGTVLLIVSGGIAAYKTLELIRLFKKNNISVTPVLTKSAQEFITPLSAAALSGQKTYTDLFNLKDETEMGHIELSRASDVILVAPLTANLMAKMAHGIADDLASTLLLASNKSIFVAPAMNVKMWEHEATRRNKALLEKDGVTFIGPDEGDMACGEYGPGRLADLDEIYKTISNHLKKNANKLETPLKGKHILITAGPTHEAIDPVRYIANHSSGKQGYALAEAARDMGANVMLISGPVNLAPPNNVTIKNIISADEMYEATHKVLKAKHYDIAICAAAVADWKVARQAKEKLKKSKDGLPTFTLRENKDILASIGQMKKNRPPLVIGFAAETEDILKHGKAKLKKKSADWIVVNDVSPSTGTFGGDFNKVTILSKETSYETEKMSKADIAFKILSRAAKHLS